MNLSHLCIKRPVFTFAMTLVLVIIGVVAYLNLSIRNLPDINTPQAFIMTQYMGADAKTVETQITTPVENAISSVNGVNSIFSNSVPGFSFVQINFKPGYDLNIGISDLRDQLSQVGWDLPSSVKPPVVAKADDQNGMPSLVIGVKDSKRNSEQITDYATRYLVPRLQQLEGVGNADMWGDRDYSMRIWLDPDKMAARGIAVNDVVNALQSQNINQPAGQIQASSRYYTLLSNADLSTAEQFANLVVKADPDFITHFYDIAQVEIAPVRVDSDFRVDGIPGLGIGITPASTANPLQISDAAQAALKKINITLPASMSLQVLFDQANFIRASINEVYISLLEAIILVVAVILLFLGNWRSTFIPVVTIPVCLITVFSVLYIFHYSINTITLLALVLAIGLVVDDAIVMLENIHRYGEGGLNRFDAAFKGSREITFAVIAMTLTLVAVYLPVAFTPGVTGIIFRQFAVALAGAVLISGFVALTLSPMMCAQLLVNHKKNRYQQWADNVLQQAMQLYRRSLGFFLRWRVLVIIVLIVLASSGYWIYFHMPSELAPGEDQGYLFGGLKAPTNSSFAYTNQYAQQVAKIYVSEPGVAHYLMSVGNGNDATRGFSLITLKPAEQRPSQQQIMQDINTKLAAIPGINAFVYPDSPFDQYSSGNDNRGISFQLLSTGSYEQLNNLAQHLIQIFKQSPIFVNPQADLKIDNQQFNMIINRNLAADLQVNISDITLALNSFYGPNQVSTFQYDGYTYPVILQMPSQYRTELSALDKIYVRSATNQMIPLSTLVTVTPTVGPLNLTHYNRMRAETISASLGEGYSLGDAVNYLEKIGRTQLPDNASYAFSGSMQSYLEAKSNMTAIFILALAFIYLVLAAQFESLIDPLIVLLSVPLSLIGGLVTLWLAGGTLNLFSEIALVTLIGLIAKHGILIVEFANQIRAQGKDKITAVIEAACLRLRPILMTTGAMVLGALPLALATGPGGATRQQIGWVIVGGMLIGTFFSLIVVPTAYTFLSRRKLKL